MLADGCEDLNLGLKKQGERHVDLSNYPFLTSSFEDLLRLGKTMEISVDDDDLYASFSLNKRYKLKKESIKIFKLLD